MKSYTYGQISSLIALILGLFALGFNAYLPLYIDEAYYWLWTKHLALSYYDHPPMIAYFIHLCTQFGDEIWQIRLVNIFSYLGASFFIFKTAQLLFDDKTAFYAFLIFILSPAVTMGFSITTPDTPLTFFWSLSFYFAARAFLDEKLSDFILTGFFSGLALTSKYTAILLLFSYFLLILFRYRHLLATPKPYLGGLFAIVGFLPVILWNIQNDFISFTFQYKHGSATPQSAIDLVNNLEFFGGMFIVFNPIFFALLLYLFFKKESYQNRNLFFVILPTLFIILFFLYKGLYKSMELNWVAPAFISACIAVAYLIKREAMKKTMIAGVILSLLMMMVIRFPLMFGLSGEQNPHNRIFGFQEVAYHIQPIVEGEVFADHLTLASTLTYYLKKEVYIPTQTRTSQFDWWHKDMDYRSMHGIYVSRSDRTDELKTIWHHVDLIEEYTPQKEGYIGRTFYIYKVSN